MRNKKIILTVIAFVLTYLLQFVLFPAIATNYFPRSNEATVFYFGSFTLLIVVLEFWITSNIKLWGLGDIIYIVLVFIYHGKGLYGIGLKGITLDGAQPQYDFSYAALSIGIYVIYIIIIEVIVKVFSLVIRKLNKR
ncbi:hypothetical protein [Anaerosporobacter sp.]